MYNTKLKTINETQKKKNQPDKNQPQIPVGTTKKVEIRETKQKKK